MNSTGINLFPTIKYRLRSALSAAELATRLKSETENSRFFGASRYLTKSYLVFRGKIIDNQFQIMSASSRIWSFQPCYTGKFIEQSNGTMVDIKMTANPFVRAILTIWIFLLLLLCLTLTGLIMQALFIQNAYYHYHPIILFPLLLLASGLIIQLLPIHITKDQGYVDMKSLFLAEEFD